MSGPWTCGSADERADRVEVLRVAAGKVEFSPLARANDVLDRLAAGDVRYRAALQHV